MQVAVHFSNIKQEIIKNLKNGSDSIKVAVAWITDEDIIRTLSQKVDAGCEVEVILSDSVENFRNTSKFKDFLQAGGKLQVASPKFLHHKFCIIDGSIIISGSYNWTYYAQRNEENILIISLDKENHEDMRLLGRFIEKYRFFWDKVSIPITAITDLERFRAQGREASVLLAQLDEEEIKLRQELEDHVRASFAEARSLGISVSEYLLERMKLDGGGVEFIKRILHDEMSSGEMKSGFRKLEEPIPHRVDLSLEYIASRPKYKALFSTEEIAFCQKLMQKYRL
jgi:phosphatidylserine/phosphatidylglycerophosphate/cardiolipin synthase-like enzyme